MSSHDNHDQATGEPPSNQQRLDGQQPTIEEGEEHDQASEMFSALFSTKKPKDAMAGASSGLKSVLKGTAAGAVSLIAQPIAGAQENGVAGFFSGLGAGIVSAVALPVTGIGVGVYQLSRGIMNTGESMAEAREGKNWDSEKREWQIYSLSVDEENLKLAWDALQAQKNGGNPSLPGNTDISGGNPEIGLNGKKVASMEYYDLLKLPASASSAEIKKSYRKQSLICHPDKNVGDSTAAAKFQALHSAYTILSDEKSREFYDKNGVKSSDPGKDPSAMDEIDPLIFFNVMFGSHDVEPYIGDLWIASVADSVFKDASAGANEDDADPIKVAAMANRGKDALEAELKQKRREVQIAINLKNRIEKYVDGAMTEAEFITSCKNEADKIASGSFGPPFLVSIGFSLEVESDEFIGFEESFLGLDGHAARAKKRVNSVQENIHIAGAGIKALRAGAKAKNEMEDMKKEEEDRKEGKDAARKKMDAVAAEEAKAGNINAGKREERKTDESADEADAKAAAFAANKLEESLPVILNLAWAFNCRDITKTLKAVCKKLFTDADVAKDVRVKRAKGVRILGSIFNSVGKREGGSAAVGSKNAGDLKSRAEVAVMTTMAKAQGQEMNEDDAEDMIAAQKEMKKQREEDEAAQKRFKEEKGEL